MHRPQQTLARRIICNRRKKPTGMPLISVVRQDRPVKKKAPTFQRVAKQRRLTRQKARKKAKATLEKRKAKQALYNPLIKPAKKQPALQARGR